MKTPADRLAERRFDPTLPPKVKFSNNGFCDSSDFSSLGIRVLAPTIFLIFFFVTCLPLRLLPRLIRCVWMGFYFRHVESDECLAAFMGTQCIIKTGIFCITNYIPKSTPKKNSVLYSTLTYL
jgi:hypothetical protein